MERKRQLYKLIVTSSDESYSSKESSPEVKKEEIFEFDGREFCKHIDLHDDEKEDHYNSVCLTESPFFSSMKLPMIIEEEAESEYNKVVPDLSLKDDEDEDESPFFVVPSNESSFEDSCEYSSLMKKLWNKSK
eukprot:CAMPEP_0197005518 /NCGR_PEP_ID=MMETSP1380-20130617/29734_1 /TAXON_ID=5936 /ORGANISM="Euplotes crassus, Strain CT5" /LENGTH=132 /DNA_ID=CAMNT_0042424687 /DNA_START=16 /DNA_END=414 /DNA_ORIENTATION=+